MFHATRLPISLLVPLLVVPGCVGDGGKSGDPVDPDLAGKADFADRVSMRGSIGFDEPVDGTFTEDFEYHGYELLVGEGATISATIQRDGSDTQLDTTLYVYGPRLASGKYAARIAFDDDGGYRALSRIRRLALPQAGAYLVVVSTYSGLGRGRYRLGLGCDSDACTQAEMPTECPSVVQDSIRDCADEWLSEGDWEDTRHAALEACTTDYAGDMFESLCESHYAVPQSWCLNGQDAFLEEIVPVCREALEPEFPVDRPPLRLIPQQLAEEIETRLEGTASECCWANGAAYTIEPPADGAEVTMAWLVDSVRQAQDAAAQWGMTPSVSASRLQDFLVSYDLGDDFLDLVRTQAGSQSFELGLLDRDWYPAAGAEAWSSLFVLHFDNGYVITLLFESGET